MHTPEVLLKIVQTRPLFVSPGTTLSKTFVVFTVSIILVMNRFEVPIQIITGGKALSLARTIMIRAFIVPFMSGIVFSIIVSGPYPEVF